MTSVLALLASPAADGLFRRAIAQSPALPLIADRELRARQAHEFLRGLGVSAAEVKGLPQRQLRRAAGRLQLKSAARTPTLAYGLTYGVDLLPSSIEQVVRLASRTWRRRAARRAFCASGCGMPAPACSCADIATAPLK